jgi:HPt (histidine-containing phosphotransfer) domain-containing protein
MDSSARETITIDMPPGLEHIMPAYLAWRREEVSELMALLAASDFERLAKLSHNIKGTGTSYGLPDLSHIGADLELAAQRCDAVAAGAQLMQLKYYLEHLRVEIPDDSQVRVDELTEVNDTEVNNTEVNDRSLTNHACEPC